MNSYQEIAALNADYWARVDQRVEAPVAELYVVDGQFIAGSLELTGQPAIAQFFAERNRAQLESGRMTRHLHVNLHVDADGAAPASCRSTVVVFAGVGQVPLPMEGPSTIADVEDVLVRDTDGQWRFVSRRLTPVFVGPNAAAFVRS